MSFCKYCGAPIDWIRTPDETMVPVDEEPVFVIEGEGRDLFFESEGEPITGRLAAPSEERRGLPVGFVPHRRTCRSNQNERSGKRGRYYSFS